MPSFLPNFPLGKPANQSFSFAPMSLLVTLSLGVVAMLAGCPNNEPEERCSPSCSSVQTCCTGICRSTFSDPANCGGCGLRCASGELCVGQVCRPATNPTDSGVRVDASTPPRDAGTVMGACRPSCNASQQCCGATCVNRSGTTATDPSFMNCRGCGIACNAETADRCGATGCLCGTSAACTGERRCGINAMGSRGCIDYQTDEANCGSMGNACAANETCTAGVCACGSTGGRCTAPTTCVGSGAAAVCVDLMTDEMNCGMAGVVCPASEVCGGGMCRCGSETGTPCARAVGIPFPSCGELCCAGACVVMDNANCGTCGTPCGGTTECSLPLFGGPIGCADGGPVIACGD